MNNNTIMLVDPMQTCWKYIIVRAGQCLAGDAKDIKIIRSIQKDHHVEDVFIDQGFRTAEVKSAAEKYGWTLTKGL